MSDDWNRYGGGRANDRGVAGAHRTAEDLADDPFFEYRYEGRGEHRDLSLRRAPNGPGKRPHPPARKLIGALLAVLIAVGTASFLNRQLWGGTQVSPASATETGPQTTPTATSAPTETATAPIVRMAHPNVASLFVRACVCVLGSLREIGLHLREEQSRGGDGQQDGDLGRGVDRLTREVHARHVVQCQHGGHE
ncbi:MAG TPA: hypothetical protein VIK11_14710, partial [Tepidiformaceae bacterium]